MFKVDYKKTKLAIELPDGTKIDVPERTAELTEKLEALEDAKSERTEYEHYQAVIELLFGKATFKKIAPKGRKDNIDYLAAVYVASIKAFFYEKERIQAAEIKRKLDGITPITDKMKEIRPNLKHNI